MIIDLLICAVSFFIGAKLLSGVTLESFVQALIVGVVVAILDVTIGNVLKIVTLGILSLGIFNWLLNAIIIQIADWFLPNFKVKNFWWALLLAGIVSLSSSLIGSII